MTDLTGKVAVIVGGAGGIGQAAARRLVTAGMSVAIADRDRETAEAFAGELRRDGARATAHFCDVTDPASCTAAMDEIIAAAGRVDLLIYSAGLTHISPCKETTLVVYERVMEVNFTGAVRVTKALLPQLIESRGQIIVLSSIAGFAPLWGRTGYCASKYALHGFFDTLRTELAASGVAVTLICPSFVDTQFARQGLAGDATKRASARATTGSLLSPERVAEAIYSAARKRPRQVVVSSTGKISWILSRLTPRLYERIMLRRLGGKLQ